MVFSILFTTSFLNVLKYILGVWEIDVIYSTGTYHQKEVWEIVVTSNVKNKYITRKVLTSTFIPTMYAAWGCLTLYSVLCCIGKMLNMHYKKGCRSRISRKEFVIYQKRAVSKQSKKTYLPELRLTLVRSWHRQLRSHGLLRSR